MGNHGPYIWRCTLRPGAHKRVCYVAASAVPVHAAAID